jgi:hypothetical protein
MMGFIVGLHKGMMIEYTLKRLMSGKVFAWHPKQRKEIFLLKESLRIYPLGAEKTQADVNG